MVDIDTFHRVTWEPADFKQFLTEGPSFDDLEIARDQTLAPVVDLG